MNWAKAQVMAWVRGPYRPRRRGRGHPVLAALVWGRVILWWIAPFIALLLIIAAFVLLF